MSRSLQLICIDLDGPILDVSERYYRIYRDTVFSIGTQPLTKQHYWELKRSKVMEGEILAESGASSAEALTEYTKTRDERIESPDYLMFDQPWLNISEILKTLRSRSALALVTMRKSKGNLEDQLRRMDLLNSFDCVLTAGPGEVANSRGERKAQLVRDCYGNQQISGWFVGDTETDILSGRLLGLSTVAITFGIRNEEHLKAVLPDVTLHSPAEFHSWAENVVFPSGHQE
jgi:phosphoglycolate phosphatase